MSIAVVAGQEDSFGDFTGATNTTVTLTFPGDWTVGNGILGSVLWYPDAAQTVTMAAGSNSGVASTESNDGTFHVKQFHIKNLSGTPGATVVFTFSAATGFVIVHATEITGQDTATQPDAAGVGQAQTGIGATADAVSSGSITTNTANAFLYGFSVPTLGAGASALVAGTGFTAFPDISVGGASLNSLAQYATRATAGAGAVTFTATGAAGSTELLTTAIAIKAAAGASQAPRSSVMFNLLRNNN